MGPQARARNVIFMVADGMSIGALTIADTFRRHRDGKPTRWVSLWNEERVRRASMSTHSADSLVTDSAAAATTWGIGKKTNNGAINITPDGRQHTPILPHAAQYGRATGIVTTTRVTHATPAGFVANVPLRSDENDIARHIVERKIDVAMGGGGRHFPDVLLAQDVALRVVRDREGLLGVDPRGEGRLLGLFSKNHVPFELDRPATCPTLAEMARAAIARLAAKPDGFVLQIEGGRVDHAAHSNDPGGLVSELLAFDDAVEVAWQFAKDRDDTLLIVTTDHANANPGITVYKKPSHAGLERLGKFTKSFEWIMSQAGDGTRDEKIERIVAAVAPATGIELSKKELAAFAASLRKEPTALFRHLNNPDSALGALLANYTGVSWVSPNHTSDHVELTAFGPGSERIRGLVDNTDLHGLMVDVLGLDAARPLEGADRIIPLPIPAEDD